MTGEINMSARGIDLDQMNILRMANSLGNRLNIPGMDNLSLSLFADLRLLIVLPRMIDS